MKRVIFIFSALVMASSYSQTVRKYSNEFLNIGVDAQSLAMANAVTASTSGVNSSYWNPAGLIGVKDSEVSLMHASYFANIAQYDYAAYAKAIDEKSTIAFSFIRFGVDDILNTTQLIDSQGNIDYDRISLFSAADYAVTFSYARKTSIEGLNYGANAKVIRRIIGDFASSWGFGFDAGIQYQKNNWKFGLMLRDITTTYNVWNINEDEFDKISGAIQGQNQDLPETTEITLPKAQLGVSRLFNFNSDYTLLAATNLNMRFEQTNDIISSSALSIDPALGVEGGYNNMVFLRAGVGNFQNIIQIDGKESLNFQPNIGVGFAYKGIQIDYALTDIGDQSAAIYSNIFSLKIDLSIFK